MDFLTELAMGFASTIGIFQPAINLTGLATSTFETFKQKWVHNDTYLSSNAGHVLWDIDSISQPYAYDPLTEYRQIRLWQVTCVGEPKRFHSTLIDVSLDDPPPYVAISYTWGDNASRSTIPCGDKGNLLLTDSVSVILDTLLKSGENTMLWVDSVCIDQKNTPEKNIQVRLMRDIYSRAQQVAVILGRAADDSDTAMDLIPQLEPALRTLTRRGEQISLESVVRSTGHDAPGPSWTALSKLLSRP